MAWLGVHTRVHALVYLTLRRNTTSRVPTQDHDGAVG